jgi:hypothetical protein
MQRNPREQTARWHPPPATATFGYAQVESALARVFDLEDAQEGAFRGRLKHFRKLGIPAENPGKGARLRYSASDIFQLLICLELSEFGIDPTLIVKIVQSHWADRSGFLAAIARAKRDRRKDHFVLIPACFMSASLGERRFMVSATEISFRSEPNPVEIQFASARGVMKALREPGKRFCTFNLSRRIRDVEKAFAAE